MSANRLHDATSPYLQQHADNPVAWWPWCEEALELAKREDKPILLSIGYSACHWCHVMAHESFEDEPTAALMNELFVNVKVDREERPDVDQVYMDAVQAMTASVKSAEALTFTSRLERRSAPSSRAGAAINRSTPGRGVSDTAM